MPSVRKMWGWGSMSTYCPVARDDICVSLLLRAHQQARSIEQGRVQGKLESQPSSNATFDFPTAGKAGSEKGMPASDPVPEDGDTDPPRLRACSNSQAATTTLSGCALRTSMLPPLIMDRSLG